MRDLIGLSWRLTVTRWPLLAAAFLGGWAVHQALMMAAGYLVLIDRFYGLLVLPVAVLARLVSLVVMLLVLAGVFSRLTGRYVPYRRTAQEGLLTVLQAAVVPFLAAYTVLGFLADDLETYQAFGKDQVLAQGLRQAIEADGAEVATLPSLFEFRNILLVAVVVVLAWGLRRLIGRYRHRLPRWVVFGEVYLQALWVFLAMFVLNQWSSLVPRWVESRQAMAWLDGLWTWLGSLVPPLDWLWVTLGEPISGRLDQLTAVVTVPLAWLVLVGTVYGSALAPQRLRIQRVRALGWIRRNWNRLDERLRTRLVDQVASSTSSWTPLRDALELMVRAGSLVIGGYVLLYSLVSVATSSIFWAVGRVLGPADPDAWRRYANDWILAIDTLVEPARIALVVATFLIGSKALHEHRRAHPEQDPDAGTDGDLQAEVMDEVMDEAAARRPD